MLGLDIEHILRCKPHEDGQHNLAATPNQVQSSFSPGLHALPIRILKRTKPMVEMPQSSTADSTPENQLKMPHWAHSFRGMQVKAEGKYEHR